MSSVLLYFKNYFRLDEKNQQDAVTAAATQDCNVIDQTVLTEEITIPLILLYRKNQEVSQLESDEDYHCASGVNFPI